MQNGRTTKMVDTGGPRCKVTAQLDMCINFHINRTYSVGAMGF